MQCRSLDFSCVDQYCIKLETHMCVKMTEVSTLIGRQSGSYNCSKINEAVGVEQCIGLTDYCILDATTPTKCVILLNNTKTGGSGVIGTGICDCPYDQCIEKNTSTQNYECVNVTNDPLFPNRVGRERKTKLCLASDDPGLREGAQYCANKYCIDPVTQTCTRYNHTSSRRYYGREDITQLCISSNDPTRNATDCAEGKFCLD